jgi:mycofactocin precursor
LDNSEGASIGDDQRNAFSDQNARGNADVPVVCVEGEETPNVESSVEELLVEEVSIDGLCGVY